MNIDERNPFTWAAIEPHLDRALELDPAARKILLAELETTQPAVAEAVQALLMEREALNAAGFLENSLVESAEAVAPMLREILIERTSLAEGSVIGPYRLIREIGYGGMSSVWLAERFDQQLKREVALKLPLLGPRMHVERFTRERDILAGLTHPNIARLYDAGISDSGQPYLAMEYVAGTGLLSSCNERRLTIRARLSLFVEVLEAVQFAHAELIIHRDLKPSNILVTSQGRVVLLDFGVAKLLTDGTVTTETPITQLSGRALTPDYASPEQIANQALGTASDIYSLGVILYELLTGIRPYHPKRDSRAALEEAILTEELRRPSQAEIAEESAGARSTSVHALVRALKGDLDTIVHKTLRKNPLERYASVSVFAQDIGNYLQQLPVSARPDSNWYRFGRFVLRHKIQVIAVSAAMLALLGGAVLAVWQARTAAVERDRAVALALRNEAVTDFLGRVITEAAESDRPVTVSEMLVRSEKLALRDTSDSPENRAAVLGMIAERYYSVDEPERALPLLKSALALLANSADHALRSRLTCRQAVAATDLGSFDASIRVISREIERLGADPQTAANCLLDLSRIHGSEHHAEETLRAASSGLERIRSTGREPGALEAALLGALAYGYHLKGSNAEAVHYFEQAMRKYTELGREHSDGALGIMNDWAIVMLGTGMPRDALSLLERDGRIEAEREPGAGPSTTTVGNLALALLSLGRYEQARVAFERECQLAVEHQDGFSEIHCLVGRASLELQTHDLDRAAADLNRAAELMGPAAPPDSPPMLLGAVLQGQLDLAQGRLDDARARFARVLASKTSGPTTLRAALGMAETKLAANDPAGAALDARRGLQTATAIQGNLPYSNFTGLAWLTLGRSLLQVGDRERAKQALAAAVNQLSNTVDADHPALFQARRLLDAS